MVVKSVLGMVPDPDSARRMPQRRATTMAKDAGPTAVGLLRLDSFLPAVACLEHGARSRFSARNDAAQHNHRGQRCQASHGKGRAVATSSTHCCQ
eukprot:6035568-Alexandrium_andersonii.AAC.1